MNMESTDFSSQERLERLFRDGKISEDDYLRLFKAMEHPPVQDNIAEDRPAERAKLRKSLKNGLIGGLCAGFGKYIGADEQVVRIVLIAAFLVLCALGGVGVLIIPLYIGVCALLPWDREEEGRVFLNSGRPRLFMSAVALLYFILPTLYSVLLLPRLETMYSNLGLDVWSAQFQSTFAGRAIDCVSEYRGYLQLNDGVIFWAVGIAGFVTLLVGTLYCNLCRADVRRLYAAATLGLGLAWMLFLAGGTLYPLLMMTQNI